MAGSDGVARALVDYDPTFAEDVLRLLARELGVAADGDVPRLQALLANLAVDDGAAKTTVEWKQGFAHVERLRSLGLEIAKLLGR
jgi:hypothetical protein